MRHPFHHPLARWGFTLLAVLALVTHQAWPALVSGSFAWLAWRTRPRKRRRPRPRTHPRKDNP